MKKTTLLLLIASPFIFSSCDTKGDCGCEVYEIIVNEDDVQTYRLLGTREGYCSQYDDLEGYYFFDVNCD